MSVKNSDLLDAELRAILAHGRNRNQAVYMDAEYEPEERTWMDKVKTVVWILFPALLFLFFFWCQQADKLDDKPAFCGMFVCVAVCFYCVGKAVGGCQR